MLQFLQKVRDTMRSPYDPNPHRRSEVVRLLAQRPSRSHEEWQREFAPEMPLSFIAWYRDTCSKYFGYDLSAALPDDRLVEDLGFFDELTERGDVLQCWALATKLRLVVLKDVPIGVAPSRIEKA